MSMFCDGNLFLRLLADLFYITWRNHPFKYRLIYRASYYSQYIEIYDVSFS